MNTIPKVKEIQYTGERVESGPVQFGDDWPGIFLRGDHALYIAFSLKTILDNYNKQVKDCDPFLVMALEEFVSILSSCDVRLHPKDDVILRDIIGLTHDGL